VSIIVFSLLSTSSLSTIHWVFTLVHPVPVPGTLHHLKPPIVTILLPTGTPAHPALATIAGLFVQGEPAFINALACLRMQHGDGTGRTGAEDTGVVTGLHGEAPEFSPQARDSVCRSPE
jgi:hypothetical protein